MADRVKYFLLGLLFLVVAGVIAYDRWNPPGGPTEVADTGDEAGGDDRAEIVVGPEKPVEPEEKALVVPPARKEPKTDPKPVVPERKPPIPVTPKPEPNKVHLVKPGESLERIAIQYYGTRQGVDWIVAANGLANPNRIFEKQKLIIPARKDVGKRPAKKPETPTPPTKPIRYTVKSGDGDLYQICRRFYGRKGEGARVARIMELNKLWSADVKAGTVLTLPPK